MRSGIVWVLGNLLNFRVWGRFGGVIQKGTWIMRLPFLAGAFVAFASIVQAQEINSLAISPDGATLLAAGDNRTLYTVDAASLAVTDRKYFPEQIRWVAYSEDGKSVFLRSQERTFSARNATNFKERFSA